MLVLLLVTIFLKKISNKKHRFTIYEYNMKLLLGYSFLLIFNIQFQSFSTNSLSEAEQIIQIEFLRKFLLNELLLLYPDWIYPEHRFEILSG